MTIKEQVIQAWADKRDEEEAREKEARQKKEEQQLATLQWHIKKIFGEAEAGNFSFQFDGAAAWHPELPGLKFSVLEYSVKQVGHGLLVGLDLIVPDGQDFEEWWKNPANAHLAERSWPIYSLADVGNALLWVEAHEPLVIQPWPAAEPEHAYGIKQVICPRCGVESEHEYTDAADISYWKCPKCGMVSKITPYDLPENGAGDGGDFSTVENPDITAGVTYEALREAMVKLAAGQEDDAQGRMLAKYLWQIAVRLEQMAITTLAMNGEIAAAWMEGELRMRDRESWNTTLDILREEILEVSNDVYRLSNLTGKLGKY